MMKKITEPEGLKLLRHRFSRVIEISIAYRAFLNDEVLIGSDKTCPDRHVASQVTHTLLVTYYSYIYSLFDKSGANFTSITKELIGDIHPNGEKARNLVICQWSEISDQITKIRHNIGFHQSVKSSGHDHGYSSFGYIHPLASEVIMHALRAYFRYINDAYEHSEPYKFEITPDSADKILELAQSLRSMVKAAP